MIGGATGSRCWSSPAPSMARTIWRNSLTKTVFAARRSTVINRRAHVPARWPILNPAIFACWWRRILRRVVWILEELPHVVNYELPNVPEDYVHRIGRTGRAAATGEALSLVCVDEHKLLRDIEKLLKKRSHALRRRAMSRTRRLKRSRFRMAVSSAAAAVVVADKIRGAGRSQQPRRQDSGAAKAKPKPRTGEGKPAGDKARPPRRPRRITPAQ